MSRPLRVQYPGAVIHISCRGNEQRDIFRNDGDRYLFLELLEAAVERFRWIVTAYVLMTNHYHLMLELTSETLSSGLQWLNSQYAQAFNRRHDRVGHLLQGRPDARLIEKETYHLNVLRYVVLNPVRAGMVAAAADYEWSSHRAVAGLASAPEWLDVAGVLRVFGDEYGVARARYDRFVADWDGKCPWNDLVGGMYLGGEAWIETMRTKIEVRPLDSEHPFRQRHIKMVDFVDVAGVVASALDVDVSNVRNGRGGRARLLAAWLGSRECLLPLTAIAAGLRIRSSSRASALARECDVLLQQDASLRAALDRCRALLYGMWRNSKQQI
jgi:putative transposase